MSEITLTDINENIVGEHYFTAADGYCWADGQNRERSVYPSALGLLTFCVLVLKNGFTVIGESACVDPKTFDREIGQQIARENAIEKVWPLMGYELKTKLSKGEE
jgi:hypothetical protein